MRLIFLFFRAQISVVPGGLLCSLFVHALRARYWHLSRPSPCLVLPPRRVPRRCSCLSHLSRDARQRSCRPKRDCAAALVSPEERLRVWVDANYTRILLREKDSGTMLEAIYAAYTTSAPHVHARFLGEILFGKMWAPRNVFFKCTLCSPFSVPT